MTIRYVPGFELGASTFPSSGICKGTSTVLHATTRLYLSNTMDSFIKQALETYRTSKKIDYEFAILRNSIEYVTKSKMTDALASVVVSFIVSRNWPHTVMFAEDLHVMFDLPSIQMSDKQRALFNSIKQEIQNDDT